MAHKKYLFLLFVLYTSITAADITDTSNQNLINPNIEESGSESLNTGDLGFKISWMGGSTLGQSIDTGFVTGLVGYEFIINPNTALAIEVGGGASTMDIVFKRFFGQLNVGLSYFFIERHGALLNLGIQTDFQETKFFGALGYTCKLSSALRGSIGFFGDLYSSSDSSITASASSVAATSASSVAVSSNASVAASSDLYMPFNKLTGQELESLIKSQEYSSKDIERLKLHLEIQNLHKQVIESRKNSADPEQKNLTSQVLKNERAAFQEFINHSILVFTKEILLGRPRLVYFKSEMLRLFNTEQASFIRQSAVMELTHSILLGNYNDNIPGVASLIHVKLQQILEPDFVKSTKATLRRHFDLNDLSYSKSQMINMKAMTNPNLSTYSDEDLKLMVFNILYGDLKNNGEIKALEFQEELEITPDRIYPLIIKKNPVAQNQILQKPVSQNQILQKPAPKKKVSQNNFGVFVKLEYKF